MSDSHQILEQLALKKAINSQLSAIIRAANHSVTLLEPGSNEKIKLETSQINNVINVAREEQNELVVTNFIRYQIGRHNAWRKGKFGEKIIGDIETGVVFKCAELAYGELIHEIEKRGGTGEGKDELLHIAYIKLMLLYLGYLKQAFIYCSKSDDPKCWDKLRRKESKDVSQV